MASLGIRFKPVKPVALRPTSAWNSALHHLLKLSRLSDGRYGTQQTRPMMSTCMQLLQAAGDAGLESESLNSAVVESGHLACCMPEAVSRPKMHWNADSADDIDLAEMEFLRQALAPGLTVRAPDALAVFAKCLPQLRRMSRALASPSLKSSKVDSLRIIRRFRHDSLGLSQSAKRRKRTKRASRC